MKFRFLFVLLILAMLTSCQTQAPNTQAIVETSVAATVAAGERAAAEVGVKRTMEAIKASGGFVESRVADAQAEYGMNTGLTVSKGDVITFSASGEWCWGGTTDCSSPDGTVGRPSAEENSAFYNGYYFGTLLGRVGDWVFPIGSFTTIEMQRDGNLELLMNDLVGGYQDNTGSITVVVSGIPKPTPSMTATTRPTVTPRPTSTSRPTSTATKKPVVYPTKTPRPYVEPTNTFEPPDPPDDLELDAQVTIINQLSVGLSLTIIGPRTYSYNLAAGETKQVSVPAGTYSYTAVAFGFSPLYGVKVLEAGESEWTFYAQ